MKYHVFTDDDCVTYLQCKECSKKFPFTPEDKAVFRKRGFTHYPSRCPVCNSLWKVYLAVMADNQLDEAKFR